MSDTSQEQNRDTTVWILPDDGLEEEPLPVPSVSIDQARDASAALIEKVRLIGEVLGVRDDPESGWARTPSEDYRPTALLHVSATANTTTDVEVLAQLITQLGWDATARPSEDVVWVDGVAGADFVRVTVVDGMVRVRAEGAAVGLDEEAVNELMGQE